jgi:hypothetical protein
MREYSSINRKQTTVARQRYYLWAKQMGYLEVRFD